MTMLPEDDRRLDDLLNRYYEPLRQANPDGRQALVDAMTASGQPAPRRHWLRASSLVAALLLLAGWGIVRLTSQREQAAFGVEGVAGRLASVESMRLRGWQRIYDDDDPQAPPIQVPLDYAMVRPDRFRFNWYGVSQGKGPPQVRTGTTVCNGRSVLRTTDETRECFIQPIHPIDARLMTEVWAQGPWADELLGPPAASYRKLAQERVRDRLCDLYIAEAGTGRQSTLSKLWIDAITGLPMMRTQDEILATGEARRILQIDDIQLDVPLAADLFDMQLPEGYGLKADDPPAGEPRFDVRPVFSGSGGNQKLETWHALQLSDTAALVFWRRSKPEPDKRGQLDWLSGLKLTSSVGGDERPAGHVRLREAASADEWNISLTIASAERPALGEVQLRLDGPRSQHLIGLRPLRFNDDELEKIWAAACEAILPPDAPRLTLEEVRNRARANTHK